MPMDETPAADKPAATSQKPQPEPAASTVTASDSPPQQTAEVVDLDKVRSEKEAQMRQEAGTIVDLCALAGMPDLAGGFIAKGMDSASVRKDLMARRASGLEVHSQVMPGDGTRMQPGQNLESNPVVASCRKIAQQHGGK